MCWDVTVSCPLAESYLSRTAQEAGAAAEMAASCKEEKYVRPLHLPVTSLSQLR